MVKTIGAGFGNDKGNIAVVSAITWNGKTFDLTCQPDTDESTSASPSTSATAKPSASHPAGAAATTAAPGAAGGLPVTGFPTAQVAGAGAGLLALGVLFLVARRRRTRFTT